MEIDKMKLNFLDEVKYLSTGDLSERVITKPPVLDVVWMLCILKCIFHVFIRFNYCFRMEGLNLTSMPVIWCPTASPEKMPTPASSKKYGIFMKNPLFYPTGSPCQLMQPNSYRKYLYIEHSNEIDAYIFQIFETDSFTFSPILQGFAIWS